MFLYFPVKLFFLHLSVLSSSLIYCSFLCGFSVVAGSEGDGHLQDFQASNKESLRYCFVSLDTAAIVNVSVADKISPKM